jgi:hypothetical protein
LNEIWSDWEVVGVASARFWFGRVGDAVEVAETARRYGPVCPILSAGAEDRKDDTASGVATMQSWLQIVGEDGV